jgi:hypothetical protein
MPCCPRATCRAHRTGSNSSRPSSYAHMQPRNSDAFIPAAARRACMTGPGRREPTWRRGPGGGPRGAGRSRGPSTTRGRCSRPPPPPPPAHTPPSRRRHAAVTRTRRWSSARMRVRVAQPTSHARARASATIGRPGAGFGVHGPGGLCRCAFVRACAPVRMRVRATRSVCVQACALFVSMPVLVCMRVRMRGCRSVCIHTFSFIELLNRGRHSALWKWRPSAP